MEMVRQMDMSYSYKPVFIMAVLSHADEKGRVMLSDVVNYFREFYENRRQQGLTVERPNSIYAKGGYIDKDVERNILINPFKRFEDMRMLRHTKTLGIIEVDSVIWETLTKEEKMEIKGGGVHKLDQYYSRL